MNETDDLPKQQKPQALGDDLYEFSVEELRDRIRLFEAEIDRTRQVYTQKTAGMDAANALFGKS